MTDFDVYKTFKEKHPTAVYHRFQDCVRWAMSVVGQPSFEFMMIDMKFEMPTFIPDATVLSIDGGLPRLDVYEFEKTNPLHHTKERELYWFADYLWGGDIYMSLTRMDYDLNKIDSVFDSKESWGEMVCGTYFIQDESKVSYKIPKGWAGLKWQKDIPRKYITNKGE